MVSGSTGVQQHVGRRYRYSIVSRNCLARETPSGSLALKKWLQKIHTHADIYISVYNYISNSI